MASFTHAMTRDGGVEKRTYQDVIDRGNALVSDLSKQIDLLKVENTTLLNQSKSQSDIIKVLEKTIAVKDYYITMLEKLDSYSEAIKYHCNKENKNEQ